MRRIHQPDGGTILTGSGTFTVIESTGEELFASAHHPFDDDFVVGDASATVPVCDALD